MYAGIHVSGAANVSLCDERVMSASRSYMATASSPCATQRNIPVAAAGSRRMTARSASAPSTTTFPLSMRRTSGASRTLDASWLTSASR